MNCRNFITASGVETPDFKVFFGTASRSSRDAKGAKAAAYTVRGKRLNRRSTHIRNRQESSSEAEFSLPDAEGEERERPVHEFSGLGRATQIEALRPERLQVVQR